MKEHKHTPGPWETSTFTNQDGSVDWDVCEEGAGDMICDLRGLVNAKANARLIAQAPAMKAEITGILRLFDRDNIPKNQEARACGAGVRVHMTYRQADRLRVLLAEIEGRPA